MAELNTPEERIAAAIWPPTDPDFRDACNAIRLYVEREMEQAKLVAYASLQDDKAFNEGRKLYLMEKIREQAREVAQIDTRIRLMKEAQKNIRPIRP